jgi:uncharacterized membrane protein
MVERSIRNGIRVWRNFYDTLFLVLIIIGVVYLIKILAGSGFQGNEKMETAEEVLKKRFVRGEISKEEFEAAMGVLKKNKA